MSIYEYENGVPQVGVEVLTEEYRKPHASNRVQNLASGLAVGERLMPGPESLKRYDNFDRKLRREMNTAQNNDLKLGSSRSEDDPELKAAAAAYDKARNRYHNFVNRNTANVASTLNAVDAYDGNYSDKVAKYKATATEKSIRRHERKTAPRVKLTRAERRKRRADREAAAEDKRKEAARDALASYERQAREYAADQEDDVRGGTFHKGTILSKREQFDKDFRTPGKKFRPRNEVDKVRLKYMKPHSGSSESRRGAAKRLGLTPRKSGEHAQETSGDNRAIVSQKPSEDNANSASPRQDSKPLTKSQPPQQPISRPDPQEPRSEPKANPKSSVSSSQPSPTPATSNKPKFQIKGKHVAGAALAVTGVTAAGLAARHIYKKRQERKRKEREAAEREAHKKM